LAAGTINALLNPLRTLRPVGHEETRVVFGLLAFLPHHFGLADHPALPRPTPGPVASFPLGARLRIELKGVRA